MSGRQTKPNDATELRIASSLRPFPNQSAQDELPAAFDQAAAMRQVDGDLALLGELTRLFIDDSRNRMNDLRRAIKQRDGRAIERIAHSIKGALSIFQARPSVEAAERVEILGRSGDLDTADAAFAVLEAEMDRLITALQFHLEQSLLPATNDQSPD